MKAFLPVIFIASLAVCASAQTSSESVPSYSYSRYQTGTPASSPKNSPFRKWTTAKLQERRLELYRMVPRSETRRGAPVYHYRSDPLPQQDEIFAIESELNRRYQAGDKTAELKRPIPGVQHPG